MSNDLIGWYHEPDAYEKLELTPEEEAEIHEKLRRFVGELKRKDIENQPDTFSDDSLFIIE
jgi:hypothetical protein